MSLPCTFLLTQFVFVIGNSCLCMSDFGKSNFCIICFNKIILYNSVSQSVHMCTVVYIENILLCTENLVSSENIF